MAYSGEYVRTGMDPIDNQYHFVLIIILTSLIIAAGISVFFTAGPGPVNTSSSDKNSLQNTDLSPKGDDSDSYIVRILWYDDQNRTYSFHDYPSDTIPDPGTYTYTGEPPVKGVKTAMVRFLSWDGTTERTIGARYIVDQETVTSILNRYSLISSVVPLETLSPSSIKTPEPYGTPVYGMLTPEVGTICRNEDGSYTATFGYVSRHEHAVTLPVGDQNKFFPGEMDRGQPIVFQPGFHHEAFSISYPGNATNQVWSLMGKQVSVGTVPEVNTSILIEPLFGYTPMEVRLTEHSTGDTKDNPLSGVWDLGDGTKTTQRGSFTHRYEKSGIYPVTYTVQNRCSQASSFGVITVYQALFSWTGDQDNPARVRFRDNSSGEPSVWFWNFGDGYSSWDQNPVHEFSYPGQYKIGLTVSGRYGQGTVVHTLEIQDTKKIR